MGKGSGFSLGVLLMNIAVAAYLFVTGIIGLSSGKWSIIDGGGEIRRTVTELLGRGDLTKILVVVLSVLAIAAGVFILLKLFGVRIKSLGLILIIFAIFWLAYMVLVDVIYPFKHDVDFLPWLLNLSCHLMVLGGLSVAADK
jgi:hypothetical protein